MKGVTEALNSRGLLGRLNFTHDQFYKHFAPDVSAEYASKIPNISILKHEPTRVKLLRSHSLLQPTTLTRFSLFSAIFDNVRELKLCLKGDKDDALFGFV